jgi:hypothetical protein
MGYLIYGAYAEYELDDRTLAHLKVVLANKLRLQVSFALNCIIPPEQGSGRISLWLSPSIPLQFRFSEPKPPALNRVWLEALSHSAHRGAGLTVMTEDEAMAAKESRTAGA